MLATGDGADMSEKLIIETDREDDGRWLAEVPALPGTMSYGGTRDEAIARVQALALRVLADRIEHGEAVPEITKHFVVAA
jgi:predicted RNase H-like HicB family nuclease